MTTAASARPGVHARTHRGPARRRDDWSPRRPPEHIVPEASWATLGRYLTGRCPQPPSTGVRQQAR